MRLPTILIIFAALGLSANAAAARQMVHLSGYPAGTIVVKTHERSLYFLLGDGRALRYPVGVGRAGMTWTGEAYIDGKFSRPPVSPPDMIRQENPRIPDVIPSGSPHNPMGAAALTLNRGQYAIHGTNSPGSIGKFVSARCILIYNH